MSGLWHHKMPSIFMKIKRFKKGSVLACQILFAHLQKWRCRFRHIDEILSANLHMAHRNGGAKKYRGFYAVSWYGLQRGEPPGVGSKKIPPKNILSECPPILPFFGPSRPAKFPGANPFLHWVFWQSLCNPSKENYLGNVMREPRARGILWNDGFGAKRKWIGGGKNLREFLRELRDL